MPDLIILPSLFLKRSTSSCFYMQKSNIISISYLSPDQAPNQRIPEIANAVCTTEHHAHKPFQI